MGKVVAFLDAAYSEVKKPEEVSQWLQVTSLAQPRASNPRSEISKVAPGQAPVSLEFLYIEPFPCFLLGSSSSPTSCLFGLWQANAAEKLAKDEALQRQLLVSMLRHPNAQDPDPQVSPCKD